MFSLPCNLCGAAVWICGYPCVGNTGVFELLLTQQWEKHTFSVSHTILPGQLAHITTGMSQTFWGDAEPQKQEGKRDDVQSLAFLMPRHHSTWEPCSPEPVCPWELRVNSLLCLCVQLWLYLPGCPDPCSPIFSLLPSQLSTPSWWGQEVAEGSWAELQG